MTARTKLVLEYPIELTDGSTIRAVMVRMPTPDDADEIRRVVFAYLCGVDQAVIDEMDAADLMKLGGLFSVNALVDVVRN